MSVSLAPAYEEHVRMPRWISAVVLLCCAGALIGAVAAAADAGAEAGERAIGAGSLLLTSVLLAVVATTFDELHIRIDARGLRFGFGPFRRTLSPSQLHDAHVEPYSWLRFGGWGLHWSLSRGLREQAYSVPLLRVGVGIETSDGHRYHVSTKRPAELAAAINAFASGLPAGAAG